ncbi:MAG: hypothetical protein IPL46_07275 [Saprospiraceae bacterium]|nr:hypothetical protein [Saprospiraceae bacterium]
MMRPFAIILLCLVTWSLIAQQEEKKSPWEVHGYVKQLQTVFKIDGFSTYLLDNLVHNRINIRYEPSEHFLVAVDFRNRIFYGDLVKLNPSYADQVEAGNNDFFDLSTHLINKQDWVVNSTIDRAYMQYTKGSFEARLGRQRINWGISTVWNPNDLFNAFSFTDFDYEERPGSDALRLKYYLGFVSSIEVAASAGKSWDDRVVAALYKWNLSQYDFQILTGFANQNWVLGGGWAGNLKTAGFKGEWSYFIPTLESEKNSFAITASVDYSFTNGFYLSGGYLYNSNGRTKGTLSDLFSFQLSAQNLYPFRHAVISSIAYPITPLLNSSLALIYSPVSSHPLFISPNLTLSIAQSWDLDLVGQLVFNKDKGNYTSPVTAGFLRLKVSF